MKKHHSTTSKARRLFVCVCVVALMMAMTAVGARVQAQPAPPIPNLGTDAGELRTERKLGDRIARELYRDPDYLEDAILQAYVEQIWHRLIESARRRGDLPEEIHAEFSWRIVLGKDRTINAFALPGGYFGLHLGMIAAIENESELAAVLAHELAHASQRHLYRLSIRQNRLSPWMLGAMILGTLAATRNPEAANAIIVGGQAAGIQSQLNFSREMEREADRIAFGILTDAGFAPSGLVTMFEKLQRANQHNDNGAFPYLRTHPLTADRIGDMRARIPPASDIPATDRQAQLMAVRAQVLAGAADARAGVINQEKRPLDRGAVTAVDGVARYGDQFGAAIRRQGAMNANEITDPLGTGRWKPNASVLEGVLAAEIDLILGRFQSALDRLSLLTGPKDAFARPIVLLTTRALLGMDTEGASRRAKEMLRLWLVEHSDDTGAWHLMARAHSALGDTFAAIRADAEASMATLDYAGAVERFKAAQRWAASNAHTATDPHEQSIVDVRLRAAQAAVADQETERNPFPR